MTRVPSIREGFIDGGFLYNYYFTVMGTAHSQRKLPAIAKEHGMVNYLGQPPSIAGCWKGMWRWAFRKENHQKAYEIYNAHLSTVGQFVSFEEFIEFLKKQCLYIMQFQSEGSKKRWLKRSGLE